MRRLLFKNNSIFREVLYLVILVIVIPMILICSIISSLLVSSLYENYENQVTEEADYAGQKYRDSIGSVIDVSVSIIGSLTVRDFLRTMDRPDNYYSLYQSVEDILKNYSDHNRFIDGIRISSVNGYNEFSTDNAGKYPFTEDEKEKMLESTGAWFWSVQSDGSFAICRLMRDIYDTSQQIGCIKILLNDSAITQYGSLSDEDKISQIALFDKTENKVVFHTDEIDEEMLKEVIKSSSIPIRQNEYRTFHKDSLYILCSERTINTRSVYMVIFAPDRTLFFRGLRYVVIVLIAVLILIFYQLFARFYQSNISTPLIRLSKNMKRVKESSAIPELLELEASGEVKELIDSFNEMSVRMKNLYEINYKNELNLRNAELLMMQSQINPHFLYNVLDSCRWMIELGEPDAASEMIQKLSETFRASVKLSQHSTVGLHSELNHVKNYIAIEKIRVGERVDIRINVQENIGDPIVVKFILQPLLENAIVHGLIHGKGIGMVIVSVYIMNGQLIYDIRDNGVGADPERIGKILSEKITKKDSLEGFALANIQSRLQLKYGEQYGIQYSQREEGGSIFIVRQPLIYVKQGEEERAEGNDC